MDKKAQGISLNFIVIAIIAALVLVIIIAFTVGGLGTSLSKIFEAGESSGEADIDLAKASCEKFCNDATQIDSATDWAGEDYCTKTFVIEDEQINCWDAPINQDCSVSDQDTYGVLWSCDQLNCGKAGCDELACTGGTDCTGENYNDCIAKAADGCKWDQ